MFPSSQSKRAEPDGTHQPHRPLINLPDPCRATERKVSLSARRRPGNCGLGISDEQRSSREGEAASRVVDYVDLRDVKAGLQLGQRHIKLEGDGVAAGDIQFFGLDQGSLIDLRVSVEE